jgi:hypothetical protein
MGSYSSTKADDVDLWQSKSEVDEDSLSIFLERDRRVRPDPTQEEDDYEPGYAFMAQLFEYAVPADLMKQRLDALGFTLPRARADYEQVLAAECDMVREWVEGEVSFTSAEELATLEASTFEVWQKALREVVRKKIPFWHRERLAKLPAAAALRYDNDYGVPGAFTDRRLFLRAYLETVRSTREVVLDVSDLVHGGYYEPDQPICEVARTHWSETHPIYGSIVILTEGRSDSRILSAAFRKMAPHLADLFGFLDFEGLRVEGSAETLAKTVRAFVGARLSSRVIALFDNDTAGAEALSSLADVALPANIKVMLLPVSSLANAYPTAGPQGVTTMDVNGLAASIELFLGAEALSSGGGELLPVRWTGWRPKLQRYQGAVENKEQIQSTFFRVLEEAADDQTARAKFPDLATVVDQLAFAFAGD